MTYRADIDGLRALAVLSVALCHAGLGFSGGYVGVDVFFVISGFLIASLMLNELQAGTFSLANFWERRLRRIVPALFVVVAVSLGVGWFSLVPKSYEMLGRSVTNLVMLNSNHFFARHTNYFADSIEEKPLLHTWSLAVEEQFYLVVPLLFWAAMRLRREAWLGPIIGVLALASFGYAVHGTLVRSERAYFLLATRAWELLAGVLAAFFLRGEIRAPIAVREFTAMAGLGSIVAPCFLYDATTPFPGFATLPPVIGAVLLIALACHEQRLTLVHRLLASRAAVGIGLISYSFYLWHWPVFVFAKHLSGCLVSAWGRGLSVVVSAVLAYITYRYVEQPFRRRRFLVTQAKLIAATAALAVILLVCGQALRYSSGVFDRLPPHAQLFARTNEFNGHFDRAHRAQDVPHNLLRIGAGKGAPRLFVWGDSHAMMVLPGIDEACRSSGVAAQCAVHSLWAPALRQCTPASPREEAEANALAAAVVQHVQSNDFDAILLAGFWSCYFVRPGFADSMLETADKLRAAGCQVYFLKDIPAYDFDVATALISCAWEGGDVRSLAFPRPLYDAQNPYHETFLPKLVERGVKILDPIPYLQRDNSAGDILPFDAGGSFYSDRSHLSVYGARKIQPMFGAPLADVSGAHRPSGPSAEQPAVFNAHDSRPPKARR